MRIRKQKAPFVQGTTKVLFLLFRLYGRCLSFTDSFHLFEENESWSLTTDIEFRNTPKEYAHTILGFDSFVNEMGKRMYNALKLSMQKDRKYLLSILIAASFFGLIPIFSQFLTNGGVSSFKQTFFMELFAFLIIVPL